MGVFKEEAYIFEAVAKKQKRIYNDAADYGYPYNSKNPPQEIQDLIDAVNSFKAKDKRDHELPFIRNRQEWDGGVSLDVVIFWEEDEGYYFGTKYSISFNYSGKSQSKIDKSSDAFISVDINSYRERVNRRR